MATKKARLKIVKQKTAEEAERQQKLSEEAEQQKKRSEKEEDERWEKAQDAMRITREEARRRVRDLRHELQRYRDQMEAVPFDIPSGSMSSPICLDAHDRKYAVDLVEGFDTRISGLSEMMDKFAEQHGCGQLVDLLFELKMHTAETMFKIGVLAGPIFTGASDREIDRLERGLVFSLMSDSRIVKSGD